MFQDENGIFAGVVGAREPLAGEKGAGIEARFLGRGAVIPSQETLLFPSKFTQAD
ncbi:MAG: hypothetical protein ACJAVK_002417 [Akkermansiaceae bacterium]|jgi:hypothetical protein